MILYYIILYDIIYVNYWYLLGKWKILQSGFIILRLQLFDKKRGIPRYLQATTDASASRASGRCLRFRHFGFWNWFQLLKMTMGFIWWFCQNKATPKSSFFKIFHEINQCNINHLFWGTPMTMETFTLKGLRSQLAEEDLLSWRRDARTEGP